MQAATKDERELQRMRFFADQSNKELARYTELKRIAACTAKRAAREARAFRRKMVERQQRARAEADCAAAGRTRLDELEAAADDALGAVDVGADDVGTERVETLCPSDVLAALGKCARFKQQLRAAAVPVLGAAEPSTGAAEHAQNKTIDASVAVAEHAAERFRALNRRLDLQIDALVERCASIGE